jgi:hypothetical protein
MFSLQSGAGDQNRRRQNKISKNKEDKAFSRGTAGLVAALLNARNTNEKPRLRNSCLFGSAIGY